MLDNACYTVNFIFMLSLEVEAFVLLLNENDLIYFMII